MSLDANLEFDETTMPDMGLEADWKKGIIDPPTVDEVKEEIKGYANFIVNISKVQGKDPDEITKKVLENDGTAMLEFAIQKRDKLIQILEEKNPEGESYWEKGKKATIDLEKRIDRFNLLIKVLS